MLHAPTPGTADSAMVKGALRYLERGWSVIPIAAADKRPLIRWREFQTRRPDAAELHGCCEV